MVLISLPPERFVQVVMMSWFRLEGARAREDIDLDDVCVLEVYGRRFG